MENNNFQNEVNNVEQNEQVNNVNQKNDIKKTVILLVVVLILVLVVGIGAGYLMSKNGGNTNKNETSANNENQSINQGANQIEVVKVVSSENDTRQMIIEGKYKNNNTVWTYTTPIENVPQEVINRGQKLIETRNGKVYLCDWGRLFILDEQTGKVLAKNTEHNIGAAAVYIFDENDNLYTTSYLAAVDKFDTSANLLKTTDSKIWDKGFYWPQKMTLNGNNLVIDYGQEGVVTVNKDTLEIIDAKNNTNKQQNQTTSNNNSNTATSNYAKVVDEIKKCLKDEQWVKQNVSLEYGSNYPENEPQKHTFIIVKDSSNNPLVVVKAQRQGSIGTMQAYIVTYKNNKVVAEEIAKDYRISALGDNTDIKVDPNNALVDYYSDLLNGSENMIYSISNGNPKELDIYGYYEGGEHEGTWYFKEHHWRGVPTITEEEYNNIKNKYQSYNFYSITTELTSENINTYLK